MATVTLGRSGGHGADPYNSYPPLSANGYPPPHREPLTVTKFEEGTIILSQPLHELWQHITNCELPSFQLIARAISTLFLALFTWHLCDGILLMRAEGLYHSFNGRIEMVTATGRAHHQSIDRVAPYYTGGDTLIIEEQYPRILVAACYLRCTREARKLPIPWDHEWKEINFAEEGRKPSISAIPNFDKYPEISAQTIRSYFANAYGRAITDREEGNTLASLVYSERLEQIDMQTAFAMYS